MMHLPEPGSHSRFFTFLHHFQLIIIIIIISSSSFLLIMWNFFFFLFFNVSILFLSFISLFLHFIQTALFPHSLFLLFLFPFYYSLYKYLLMLANSSLRPILPERSVYQLKGKKKLTYLENQHLKSCFLSGFEH